jgi:transmembrane sensor
MNYSNYTVEDFVTDESFIQWVKNPGDESNAFWNAWLSQNPEKGSLIKEAKQIVLMLHFRQTHAPEGKFLEIWERISEPDGGKVVDISLASVATSRPDNFRIWYKVAAAILVGAIAFTYVLLTGPRTIIVQTAFGEARALFLPDSTKVTINGNSILRYTSDFNRESREVWLDGEAFFAVERKKDNRNFLVHTDELLVEVLGTRFNVSTRRGKSRVALEEGKVKIGIADGETSSEIVMEPGDLVEVSGDTKQIEKKRVDVSNYSSWRMNKLFFVSTSIEEIVQVLEDNYGFKVMVKDESLKSQRFTGSSSVDNPDELIEKLNKVFGLNIQRRGNDLVIQY